MEDREVVYSTRASMLHHAALMLELYSRRFGTLGKEAIAKEDIQGVIDLLIEVAEEYEELAEQLACLPLLPGEKT